MTSSGSVFSQTLQEITTTKLEELAKKRQSFEQQKATVITHADSKDDPLDMLVALADGAKTCFSVASKDGKIVRGSSTNARLETDLRNLARFIDQTRFDPSVSDKIIQQWKATLLKHLETQSLKYQYADLYGQLTMEWLTATGKGPKQTQGADGMNVPNDFEEVSVKAKLEARRKWEESVFDEAKVNPTAITNFLTELFGDNEAHKALEILRREVSSNEIMLANTDQFHSGTLRWVIKGLLTSDLLTNEQCQVLRDLKSNDVILTELADVLNMRMASLDSWSWGREVPVEARRQLNGKYSIHMHEDLLQAIFLQYIGVQWSVKVKAALMRFQGNAEVWESGRQEISLRDKQRRSWYMCSDGSGLSVHRLRSLSYRAGYFVSKLMDDVNQDLDVEQGDEEAEFEVYTVQSAKKRKAPRPQAARMSAMTVDAEEADDEEDMGFGFIDNSPPPLTDLTPYKPKNPMDAKQRLLHLLSTEILIKTSLHSEITAFRSQYEPWYSSLPHGTVLTILSFFGVSDKWLDFFSTFLRAPLKFLDEDERPRPRMRGTPDAHVLSDFFGETTLFCLDYAINQESTGENLWRMQDDIWFWPTSHEQCVQTWSTIQRFNKLMGLGLDPAKSAAVRMKRQAGAIIPAKLDSTLPTGEIRWGMISLDDSLGRFTIDSNMVDKHIEELRKQLKHKESSIFAWVEAYSVYSSVFFTTNFGKPANCFGREHIDAMLSMHERIQKTLFAAFDGDSASSVVDWVKIQIEQRFGVKDVPDGYLFLPTAFGGLNVKSPFIGLLQLRDSVVRDPEALIGEFQEAERERYDACRKRYLANKPWERPKRERDHRPENPLQFMPFDEYIKFREDIDYGYHGQLSETYQKLLVRPEEEPLEIDHNFELENALQRVPTAQGQPTTITQWYRMDPYWKWVTMLYGPEIVGKYGGFGIVDPGLLPMGMLTTLKSKSRVSWQE